MFEKRELLSILNENEEELKSILSKCDDEEYLNELLDMAKRQKILPNVINILKNRIGTKNQIFLKKYNEYTEAVAEFLGKQEKTIELIDDLFNENRVIWIKGIPQSEILYNDYKFRKLGDIDLLVKAEDLSSVIKTLEKKGFKKVGILDEEFDNRFSVFYHEVEFMSPFNVLTEIKVYSGEMTIIKNERMIDDFWNNIKVIKIFNKNVQTLNLTYTLIHLFLAAFSNSTAYYDMRANGIRDLYELKIFIEKYNPDFEEIFNIASLYGMYQIIYGTLQKLVHLFGVKIDNEILEKFNNAEKNQHEMDKLYGNFLKYYDINPVDELFDISLRTKAYKMAIAKAFYNEDFCLQHDSLNKNFLKYDLRLVDNKFKFDIWMNKKFVDCERENILVLQMLLANENLIAQNGYNFEFIVLTQNGKVKALLQNEFNKENYPKFCEDYDSVSIEKEGDFYHFVYNIEPVFIAKDQNKLCYNIQLVTHNKNDNDNTFEYTALCQRFNTILTYHTIKFR